jgi:chromosome partitioning protein
MMDRRELQPAAVGWPASHHDGDLPQSLAALGWPENRPSRDRQRRESAARIWRRTVHAHVADESDESDVSRETSEAAEGSTESQERPTQTVTPEPDVSRETSTVTPASPLDTSTPVPVDPDVSRETEIDIMDTPIAREAMRAVHVLNPSGTRQLPRPTHRRVLTLANQKGGVGKTTSTVNLGVALALHGVRVLVIDLDPQGNASTGLGVPHQQGTPSIYEVLVDERPLSEVVAPVEVSPLLKCAPATIDLAGSEIELVSMERRESRLKQAINQYADEVDYVLIDCPPSLGLLTVNAFVAATEVLIPIQCEYYALEGLGQLLNNIELVTAHLNPALIVSTILLTMYDGRTKLADQVAAEVREHFGDRVLRSVIPRSVRVSEAPGFGQSVITYDPGSRGALSYLDAADELAQRGAEENAGQGS